MKHTKIMYMFLIVYSNVPVIGPLETVNVYFLIFFTVISNIKVYTDMLLEWVDFSAFRYMIES